MLQDLSANSPSEAGRDATTRFRFVSLEWKLFETHQMGQMM